MTTASLRYFELSAAVASLIVLAVGPALPNAPPQGKLDVYINTLRYEQRVAPQAIGDPATALLVDRWLNGNPATTFAPDTVYVVEFFASWCQPCRKSVPELDAIARRYAVRGLKVIGLAGAEQGGPEAIVKFLSNRHLSFSVAYRRSADMYERWVRAARGSGLPWVFVVDRQGRLAWWGQPFYNEFEPLLESVLNNRHSIGAERNRRAARVAKDRQGWKLRLEADQALSRGDWEQASLILGRVVELDPQRYWWEVVERIGLVGNKMGRPAQARLLATKAIRSSSWNNPHALVEIAGFLLTGPNDERRDPRLALVAARRANQLTLGADADVRRVLALAEGANASRAP